MNAVGVRTDAAPESPPNRLVHRWATERFGTYGRASLLAGLVLTPLVFHPQIDTPFSTAKLTTIWFSAIVALGFLGVRALVARRWIPAFPIGWASLAVLAATVLATAFSLSPKLSLLGLHTRNGGLVPLAAYVATMFAVVGLYWTRPKRLASVLNAIGLAAVVVSASVLLQQAGIDRALWPGPVVGSVFDYPVGTIGYSNFAGGFLGMALPCLWYTALTSRHRVFAVATQVGMATVTGALWFTQSRGGMVAAGVGLGAMAVANRQHMGRWAKAAIASVALLGVGLLTIVGMNLASTNTPSDLGANVLRTATLEYRLSYWEASLRLLGDHPIVGTGPETFYAYYPLYRTSTDDGTFSPVYFIDKPHNIFLERATDTGLLGIGSYLTVVGLTLAYGWRRRRHLVGDERLLLAGFLGLFAAYLGQGVFSIDLPHLAVLGWVAVGGIAVLADPALRRARETRDPELSPARGNRRWPMRLGSVAIVAVAGALLVVGLRPLRADIAVSAGRTDEAVRLNPLNERYKLASGDLMFKAAVSDQNPESRARWFEVARSRYSEALHLLPRDITTMLSLARLETAWATSLDPSRFRQAEDWWGRILSADPRNTALRQGYSSELLAAERRTMERWQTEGRVRPRDIDIRLRLAHLHIALFDKQSARSALEEVLAIDPANRRARELLATLR